MKPAVALELCSLNTVFVLHSLQNFPISLQFLIFPKRQSAALHRYQSKQKSKHDFFGRVHYTSTGFRATALPKH